MIKILAKYIMQINNILLTKNLIYGSDKDKRLSALRQDKFDKIYRLQDEAYKKLYGG